MKILSMGLPALLVLTLFACSDADDERADPNPSQEADPEPEATPEPSADPEPTPEATPEANPEPEATPEPEPPLIEPLDFAAIGPVTLIRGGFGFTEGPAWDRASNRLLFSDIDGDTIHSYTAPDTFGVFLQPSGQCNGLAFDPEGRLLIAGHLSRNVTRTDLEGNAEILADNFEGQAFNSPNDIVARADGTIYFTDPLIVRNIEPELDFEGLFRIDPQGNLHLELAQTDSPNGVILSPDGTVLYVTYTFIRELRAYDVAPDGRLSGERVIARPTIGDGLAVDRAGYLYVTTGLGIVVYSPDGAEQGTIPVPEIPANCTFGGPLGDTLFITARKGLYQIAEMPIPGF